MAHPSDSGGGAGENDWMAFVTALLFRGTMGWDEIMRTPLLRLNAIQEALRGEYFKNLGLSPGGAEDGHKEKETPPM